MAMERIASIQPGHVPTSDLDALDEMLNTWAAETDERRYEGDLVEFVTHLSETLRQGEGIHLFASP